MTKQSSPGPDSGPPRGFDWSAAYMRLARLESAHAETTARAEAEQQLLRRRAAALALPDKTDEAGEVLAFIGFTVGGEQYAVPVEQVQEVIDAPSLLTVPGGPDLLHGIFNYRGTIVAAIRLVRLLGGEDDEGGRYVIVVAAEDVWVGIPAQEVAGIVQIPSARISPTATEAGGETHPAVRGIAEGVWVVLDAAYLVGDSRLIVDEEVQMPAEGGKTERGMA